MLAAVASTDITISLSCIYRGVEKALDEALTPAPEAEVSEEAVPAAADETNGPTPEQIAEAEAKVLPKSS